MQKTAVNPWNWSLKLGYNQAELVEGAARQLLCSGQTSVDADGNPLHPGDMRAQMGKALENLEAVLAEGGMTLANIVRLTVYSTDVDATLANYDLLGAKMGPMGATPPTSLIGVTRLAIEPLMIELEATAMD